MLLSILRPEPSTSDSHGTSCSVRWQFNLKIDARNRQRAWGAPAVSSWYKNSSGRVTQNWPGTHREWWEETLAPDPEDFLLN